MVSKIIHLLSHLKCLLEFANVHPCFALLSSITTLALVRMRKQTGVVEQKQTSSSSISLASTFAPQLGKTSGPNLQADISGKALLWSSLPDRYDNDSRPVFHSTSLYINNKRTLRNSRRARQLSQVVSLPQGVSHSPPSLQSSSSCQSLSLSLSHRSIIRVQSAVRTVTQRHPHPHLLFLLRFRRATISYLS